MPKRKLSMDANTPVQETRLVRPQSLLHRILETPALNSRVFLPLLTLEEVVRVGTISSGLQTQGLEKGYTWYQLPRCVTISSPNAFAWIVKQGGLPQVQSIVLDGSNWPSHSSVHLSRRLFPCLRQLIIHDGHWKRVSTNCLTLQSLESHRARCIEQLEFLPEPQQEIEKDTQELLLTWSRVSFHRVDSWLEHPRLSTLCCVGLSQFQWRQLVSWLLEIHPPLHTLRVSLSTLYLCSFDMLVLPMAFPYLRTFVLEEQADESSLFHTPISVGWSLRTLTHLHCSLLLRSERRIVDALFAMCPHLTLGWNASIPEVDLHALQLEHASSFKLVCKQGRGAVLLVRPSHTTIDVRVSAHVQTLTLLLPSIPTSIRFNLVLEPLHTLRELIVVQQDESSSVVCDTNLDSRCESWKPAPPLDHSSLEIVESSTTNLLLPHQIFVFVSPQPSLKTWTSVCNDDEQTNLYQVPCVTTRVSRSIFVNRVEHVSQ